MDSLDGHSLGGLLVRYLPPCHFSSLIGSFQRFWLLIGRQRPVRPSPKLDVNRSQLCLTVLGILFARYAKAGRDCSMHGVSVRALDF